MYMSINGICTKNDLILDFKGIGLSKGMNLMVHSSLRSLGYVVNGANDVIDALLEIVGEEGILMMPSHTGDKTDPADWKNPPVPAEWVPIIRDSMKPFDPKTTPIRGRGNIPDTLLLYDGVFRSSHPIESVIAKGKRAKEFVESHPLNQSEGIESPIGKLYQNDGYVLLIGVDLSSNTSLHLAEYIVDVPYLKTANVKALVTEGKNRQFVRLERYPESSKGFINIEKDLLQNNLIKISMINKAEIKFMKLKPVIDFVVERLLDDQNYLIKE